jgi:hypothetical protein
VAAAGTVGGVAGGFAAERIAALATSEVVLLSMCFAQLIAAGVLTLLPHSAPPSREAHVRSRDVLRESPYLRSLMMLVLIGTFSAALLDYVLKVEARATFGPGDPLLRFFAMFHTSTAVLSFLLQALAAPVFLSRLGLGPTIATLPAAVAAGSALALFNGGFWILVAARGLESVLRGSLFRAGYELFYTPMLPAEKRSVKSITDVTVDRLGDTLGGGFAQAAVTFAGALSNSIMLGTAAIASCAGWLLAGRLNHAYVKSLERSLSHHASDLDLTDDDEPVPYTAVTVAPMFAEGATTKTPFAKRPMAPPPWLRPEDAQRFEALVSGDRERVRTALTSGRVNRESIPYVIPFLRRKSLRETATVALAAVAPQHVGQLSDYLLDPATEIGIRTVLPGIIATAGGTRAMDALIRGLTDQAFEVRVQCGRALDVLRQNTGVEIESERIYTAVREELADVLVANSTPSAQVAARPDLEHVFALLSVVLPREPVRVAFEALRTSDEQLRGLALEYLETALPPAVRDELLEVVDRQPDAAGECRPADVIRQELTRMITQVRSELQRSTGTGGSD